MKYKTGILVFGTYFNIHVQYIVDMLIRMRGALLNAYLEDSTCFPVLEFLSMSTNALK